MPGRAIVKSSWRRPAQSPPNDSVCAIDQAGGGGSLGWYRKRQRVRVQAVVAFDSQGVQRARHELVLADQEDQVEDLLRREVRGEIGPGRIAQCVSLDEFVGRAQRGGLGDLPPVGVRTLGESLQVGIEHA